MKRILRKIGAYLCYALGVLLVFGVLSGERHYLIGVPGFFALGMILDGFAD